MFKRPPRAGHMKPSSRQVDAMCWKLASVPFKLYGLNGPSMQQTSRKIACRFHRMAPSILEPGFKLGSGQSRFNVADRVKKGGSVEFIHCAILVLCPLSSLANSTLDIGLFCSSDIHDDDILVGRRRLKVSRPRIKLAVGHPRISMAPRTGHLGPRRGRNYGQRAGSRGRGQASPKRLSPLAVAEPPSSDSDYSGSDISNAVQTATLRYRRRRDKPVVKAMISVIFSEENEEEENRKDDTAEQVPPSSDDPDSSYSPEFHSKVDEESTQGFSAEQAEALKEIGSIKGKEPMEVADNPMDDLMETQSSKPASPLSKVREEESEDSFDYTLYLKLPPGIDRLDDLPAGREVTWERDPVQAAEDKKKRAQEREAEEKQKQNK